MASRGGEERASEKATLTHIYDEWPELRLEPGTPEGPFGTDAPDLLDAADARGIRDSPAGKLICSGA